MSVGAHHLDYSGRSLVSVGAHHLDYSGRSLVSVGAHHLDYIMNTLCVGLPLEEAKNLGYYMHFREEAPDNKQTQKVCVAYDCSIALTLSLCVPPSSNRASHSQ